MKKLLSIFLILIASNAHAAPPYDWRNAVMGDVATSASSAPVFVGSNVLSVNDGVGANSSPNTVTLNKPAGTASGQLIILVSSLYDSANTSTVTWPDGFTENANTIYVTTPWLTKVRIATKIAGSSEPSTYNVTGNTAAYQIHVAAIMVYSGVNATTPIEAITATAYSTSDGYITTHTAIGVGLTSGTANRKLVQISGIMPGSGTAYSFTPPSSFTSRVDYPDLSSYSAIGSSDYTDVAGTNVSDQTASFTGTANSAGRWAFLFALKPQ